MTQDYLSDKFTQLGTRALINVLTSKVSHKKILNHLQFIRKAWTQGVDDRTFNTYIRRNVYGRPS